MGIFSKLFHGKEEDSSSPPPEESASEQPAAPVDAAAPPMGEPEVPPLPRGREAKVPPAPATSESGGIRPPPVMPPPTRTTATPRLVPPARKQAPVPSSPEAEAPAPAPRKDTEPMTIPPPRPPSVTRKASVPKSPGVKSTRAAPTKPSPRKAKKSDESPSIARAVSDAIDGIEHHGAEPAGEGTLRSDAKSTEELELLFRRIAAEHARHLRDFAFELSIGNPGKQWVELCSASLSTLLRAAEKMNQVRLTGALTGLGRALDEAKKSPASRIEGRVKERLLERYASLQRIFPEAFAEQGQRDRREPIIVDALLRLTPGVHRLAIDKLYAAGLDRLSTLCTAKPDEVAQTTGLAPELCRRIVQQFQNYEQERSAIVLDESRSAERRKLSELVRQLERYHADFREAEAEEDTRRRREARKRRDTIGRTIALVLAQLGETELLQDLERVSVDRKLDRLNGFLNGRTSQASAPSP